jgi:hypothetical protein
MHFPTVTSRTRCINRARATIIQASRPPMATTGTWAIRRRCSTPVRRDGCMPRRWATSAADLAFLERVRGTRPNGASATLI